MDPSDIQQGTYNSAAVMYEESAEIFAQCQARDAEWDLNFDHKKSPGTPDYFGVAFSGGGIRSACVGLGILQGLARGRILSQVHYLSGISGGGYIVGWLTAWIWRQKSLRAVEDQLGNDTADGQPAGKVKPPRYERHLEPGPLHYLRRYTSYLAPRTGLFSGDTLAMISVYLRNLLLNQAMLACVAVAIMLLLQFPAFWNSVAHRHGVLLPNQGFWPVVGIFAVAYLAGMWRTAQSLHCLSSKQDKEWRLAATMVITCAVISCAALWVLWPLWYLRPADAWPLTVLGACLVTASAAFTEWYDWRDVRENKRISAVQSGVFTRQAMYILGWAVAGLCGLVMYVSLHHWLVASVTVNKYHPHGVVQIPNLYNVLGLPIFLFAAGLVSYVWVGIAGDALPDAKREWLARGAGYFLAIGLVIAAFFSAAFYGPLWMHLLFSGFHNASWKKYLITILLPGGWIFTVVSGLWGAHSSSTSGEAAGKSGDDATASSGMLDKLIGIAPPVFLAGVLLLTSWGTHAIVVHNVLGCASESRCREQYVPWADWAPSPAEPAKLVWPELREKTAIEAHHSFPPVGTVLLHDIAGKRAFALKYFVLWMLFAFVAYVLATRLDVNEFSLHLFYRNRLVRAFLGASRSDPRNPSPFTGFAYADDVYLKALKSADGFQGPYPIWGTCLNLTSGEDLAWQQRKGASFIFSPLFCGWDYLNHSAMPKEPEWPAYDLDESPHMFHLVCGTRVSRELRCHRCNRVVQRDEMGARLSDFGYRCTLPRGVPPGKKAKGESTNGKDGYLPGYGGDGGAPLIGTAMAASGAAVSPNSGYHSQPGVATLLALFNLRLGWWSGNPRHPSTWMKYAPSIWYLAAELMGKSNDGDRYVYLSDGGHFENLGLYELVRRRVRFIICSDADADPSFQFGDLGNAIDHCRRDFGVEITIGAQHSICAAQQEGFRDAHYAIGEICYPGQKEPGILLYIKSSLTNDEPSDVLGMKAQDPKFPHDATLDQFFNESMFESYRALGQHMMDYLIQASNAEKTAEQKPWGKPSGDRVRALFDWARKEIQDQRKPQAAPKKDPDGGLMSTCAEFAASVLSQLQKAETK
jgi:hypothetical protein